MKSFSATLIVIGTLFYVACNVDSRLPEMNAATSHSFDVPHDTWRRTAQGWESTADWQEDELIISPVWIKLGSIHPALVASLQLLISLGALIAWTSSYGNSIAQEC